MNLELAYDTLKEAILSGVREFVVCPGARNVPWIQVLVNDPAVKVWWGYEERSSAFFALGRSRSLSAPVAVLTTSGTAAGELLPAAMEAFYTSVPLVLMTADRPRRFRDLGTPQTCIQPGIFGPYAPDSFDIEAGESVSFEAWEGRAPLHINVSFEEPERALKSTPALPKAVYRTGFKQSDVAALYPFLEKSDKLLTIVSTLKESAKESVADFLEALGGDLYLEGVSGLRGRFPSVEPDLSRYTDVLRIGGVPTHRCWRDLEELSDINVFSLSEDPFPALSHGEFCRADLSSLTPYAVNKPKIAEKKNRASGMVGKLSEKIGEGAHVYLGNSLPIRQWDAEAVFEDKGFKINASRGLNGIDGQISTFLGLAEPERENWAILGDLTTLYDLSAPWFLKQRKGLSLTIAVLNNHGGKIFEPMFAIPEMMNTHTLSFEAFAKLWGMDYELWTKIPEDVSYKGIRVVEIAV